MFDTTTTPTPGENDSLAVAGSTLRLSLFTFFAFTRTAVRRLFTAAGVCALAIISLLFFRPELADVVKTLSPFSTESIASDNEAVPPLAAVPAPALPVVTESASTLPEPAQAAAPPEYVPPKTAITPHHEAEAAKTDPREQKWVTTWLSRRYRVATDATNMLVSSAYMTAKEMKLDPLLILAVMAIESGLNPFAESPVGAQGLMQVMSKVHHDKFRHLGGVQEAFNPVANIKVGAMILKDYVRRAGSVEGGLKMYVGAGASDNDSGYGSRVIAEYHRLKEVAAGKLVPTVSKIVKASPKPTHTAEPVEAHATGPADATKDATPEVDAMKDMPKRSAAPHWESMS
ncbi:MAG: hypothetical protein JWR21_4252 [Herminiimonas sp.]|nr:hypothetical protein [Herminiimonas sp.]MDB5853354.1 hypothetical protein [Herminiimonas sp.]